MQSAGSSFLTSILALLSWMDNLTAPILIQILIAPPPPEWLAGGTTLTQPASTNMADVWISRKRWTCKYCEVTINDDLPSRRHHETGVRHKQNVQKALEQLYRKAEQERKDVEHTKKEMARIEALAAQSYAKDQACGDGATASTSRSTALTAGTKFKLTMQPGLAHLARANTRRAAAERPAEASQHIAQPGEWQQVEPVASASTSSASETTDRDRARSFRVKEKMARLDDSDEDQDLDTIKIKKRPRAAQDGPPALRKEIKEMEQAQSDNAVKEEVIVATEPPLDTNAAHTYSTAVKKKEDNEAPDSASTAEGGGSPTDGGGGLFKKRRAGAAARAKRVRAVI